MQEEYCYVLGVSIEEVKFGNSLNQPAAVGFVFMCLSIPIVFGMKYLLNRRIQDVET